MGLQLQETRPRRPLDALCPYSSQWPGGFFLLFQEDWQAGHRKSRAQEVPGTRPAGQEGAECGTLAAPAVYVAFMAAMSLTAETQPAQDPGLSLLSDNK